MDKLLLTLQYDGTQYHGWQVQDNAVTVQQVLQDSISSVFQKRESIIGCSRTDSGVHAKGFVALISGELADIPLNSLPMALNTALPDDISVLEASHAPENFHPRYDALGKEYIYRIHNSRRRDPFIQDISWQYTRPIDVDLANELCQKFVGKQDFAAFMAAGSKIIDTVREIKYFNAARQGDDIIFTVAADGFLYNMVRIMVGTVAEAASGTQLPPMEEIIASKSRALAGTTAPAKGLTLNRVFY